MYRPLMWAAMVALTAAAAPGETGRPVAEAPKVSEQGGIRFITVSGTPYEMGLKRGLAMAKPIRRSIRQSKARLAATFGPAQARRMIDWATARAGFAGDVHNNLPDVWAEISGIAAGAGVSIRDVLLLNLHEELYEAAAAGVGLRPLDTVSLGCTAMAVQTPSARFLAQNVDCAVGAERTPLIVRYVYTGKQVLLYTFPGVVGGVGVNSRGVAVGVTILPQGPRRASDGLGATFLTRAILQQDSVEAATAALESMKRFSSAAYVIAGFDRALLVETSPNEWVVEDVGANRPAVVRANHAIGLESRRDLPGLFADGKPALGTPLQTLERRRAAVMALSRPGSLDAGALRRLLVTEPVNMRRGKLTTVQSVVIEYDGATVRMLVSAGCDPTRTWSELDFDKSGEAGSETSRSRIASEPPPAGGD